MTAKSDNFRDGALHKKLVVVLPIFAQDPFSDAPKLDVEKLYTALQMSHETVYKWLRKSRLTYENVKAIHALCHSKENLAVLKKLGRTPPEIADFLTFLDRAAA